MRGLTVEERGRLEELQLDLDAFVQEGFEVLGGFIDRLGFPEPYLVLRDAEGFLPGLDLWMSDQVVAPEDRAWIITRIGYFIAELFNQRHTGYWFVDENPESPYFLQYVVGAFALASNTAIRIPPFALAANYVDGEPPRSFTAVIMRVEGQLRQLKGR